MNRVTHFEIYTSNPESVQPFYRDLFGWKFQKFEGGPIEYWLVTTGDDDESEINGGMTRPREGQSPGTINTVAVKSGLLTLKQAAPEAVVIVGAYKPVAEFIKLSRKTGFNPVFVNISFVGANALAKELGNVFGIIEHGINAK